MTLTTYLALYAAILSTCIFFWNIVSSKPRLKVELILSLDEHEGESKIGVSVVLKNPSRHTVHVRHVSLLYQSHEINIRHHLKWILRFKRVRPYMQWVNTSFPLEGLETGLPISIEPYESHRIFIPEECLHEMMEDACSEKIGAVAQDALAKNVYSRTFEMLPKDEKQSES